jgi:hypothetical protein
MAKENDKTYLQTIEDLRIRIKEKDEEIKILKRIIRDGVFCGKEEIMLVYDWSKHIFKKWVKIGLPCLIVDRMYYAHKDNINEYFKAKTRISYQNASDEMLDDDDK